MRTEVAYVQHAKCRWSAVLFFTITLCVVASIASAITPNNGQAFTSAEGAAQALANAAKAKDRNALRSVLGAASEELQASDKVQGDAQLAAFAEAYDTGHRIIRERDGTSTLEVGVDHWPLPIPLVEERGQWYFDTDAGKQEIINRRIGRNELSALRTVRAYADAQREYASRDRDNDHVLEYAQKILSPPGTKDGLYWAPQLDGEFSPLGPLVASARGEGYLKASNTTAPQAGPQPFHGYYFRILTQQGKHAPGGKYDYVINGNMIGGFALVAWPADYGESGVMTFIINQEGRVFQKDLGSSTDFIARKMDTYDPDSTWMPSAD